MTELGRTDVTFTDSIRTCFVKYFDFSGRASRPEFWWFFLFAFLAQAVLGLVLPGVAFLVFISPFLAVSVRRFHDTGRSAWWLMLYLASGLGSLILVAIGFVLAFADDSFFTGVEIEAGDFAGFVIPLLLGLVTAFVCGILPLVFCAAAGTVGPNRYGPDPLQSPAEGAGPDTPAPDPIPDRPLAEPESGRPRFCAQCGTGLAPDAKFCGSCGAAV